MPDQSELLDQTDDVIEHSPLERDITRDGATVRVSIYRGREDAGWILEIEDGLGGSTVWDDVFDSDQAALDEALRTIEEDGIHSFTEPDSDRSSMRALWDLATAQPAIAELRRTLTESNDTSAFHRACGVFAAVASAPELRRPSEWLDLVKGDRVFEDLADAQRFANGVMALYDAVLRSVSECGAHCCPPPEDHAAVGAFCEGYVRIASTDPAWSCDAQALEKLAPMRALAGAEPLEKWRELAHASDEDLERWLQREREELAQTVLSLHAYGHDARQAAAAQVQRQSVPQRRAVPKVGRNQRCPCGSGKKYKKCCAQ